MSDIELVTFMKINGRSYEAVDYEEALNILGRKRRCLQYHIAKGSFPYHEVREKGYLRKLDVERLAKKLNKDSQS